MEELVALLRDLLEGTGVETRRAVEPGRGVIEVERDGSTFTIEVKLVEIEAVGVLTPPSQEASSGN